VRRVGPYALNYAAAVHFASKGSIASPLRNGCPLRLARSCDKSQQMGSGPGGTAVRLMAVGRTPV